MAVKAEDGDAGRAEDRALRISSFAELPERIAALNSTR